MKQFAELICNLLPSECRKGTLEGKDYTVVPMVILTEGVHVGSQGPLYYPKDELAKTPVVWNHKPIVVYHPTMNGEGISACDPEIINTRKIGLMLNTKFDKGRLKSEAWIDPVRADEVDERINVALNAKEMMELSTGVYIDVEDTSGKWKSEEYVAIARNYRPDHLALLPDQIGACSINDGAGLLRNTAQDTKLSKEVLQLLVKADLVEDKQIFDVRSNFAIYERDGKLWRIGFTSNEKGVTLDDEDPVEVKREYRTVNKDLSTNTEHMKTKKDKVDGIIAANAGFAETDRKDLMELTDPQLDSMLALHKEMPGTQFGALEKKDGKVILVMRKAKEEPADDDVDAGDDDEPAPKKKKKAAATPAANAEPGKVVTLQEYVQQAPKEVQEVLNNSLQIYNEEKAKLVETILANANNGFTKEDLSSRPLGELRNLARLAAAGSPDSTQIPHYGGQAPTDNNQQADEALPVPTMNFDKKAA